MEYRPASSVVVVVLAALLGFAAMGEATPPTPTQIANLNTETGVPGELVTTVRLGTRSVFLILRSSGTGVVGDQIWTSDGTEAGTIRLLDPDLCDTSCFDTFQIVSATDDRTFFVGVESVSRIPQLFVTDGTPAGTIQLTQLPPGGRLLIDGRARLHVYWSERLQRLFFMALESEDTGWELWSTDGTPGSTRLLLDIFEGPDSSLPFFDFGAETDAGVIFTAFDENGDEPWRTDGTPQGTIRLGDITPSASFVPPGSLTQAGDRVVFLADDGAHGRELWTTDGTPQGTRLLLDATTGPMSSTFVGRLSVESQAFFVWANPENTLERRLLRTDGTSAGTRILGDFEGVPGGLPALDLVGAIGAEAFFTVSGQLWTTDGTISGTRAVDCFACPQEPHLFRKAGDRLVFRATDAARGLELWETDGTPDGTAPLADLCPGPCSSDPFLLGASDRELYVMANDGTHGVELWTLDRGNAERLTDFSARRPFPLGMPSLGLAGPVEGDFEFPAADLENGFGFWTTDGTSRGTRPIRKLADVADAGSHPHAFTTLQRGVIFAAETGTQGLGLWRLGTPGSFLERIATLDPDHLGGSVPRIQAVTSIGINTTTATRMYFADERQGDGNVWFTDGTGSNTRNLGPGLAFGSDAAGRTLPALGSAVFFRGVGDRSGLWITDGTIQNTRQVRDVVLAGHVPAVEFGGRVWFSGLLDTECQCETELWSSDGTTEGTRPFANLNGADPSEPRLLTSFRGNLYFVTSSDELFRTNGVAPPVEALPNILGRIEQLTVLGNRLLLSIDSGGSEPSLWATDGTAAGTVRIAPTGIRRALPQNLPQQALLEGDLFFLDNRGRLWRTDGTPGGTFPVDLFPDDVREILGVHSLLSRLLFVVRDDRGLEQVWVSAGTAAETEPLPGIRTAGRDLAITASQVILSLDDGRTGLEPWTLPLSDSNPPPPPPPPGRPTAPGRLQAEGLSFGRILLSWEDRSNNETSFEIQAKGSRLSSVYETVATVPGDTTSFVVTNLESGRPYELRIRARNGDGASDWSAVAVGTPVEVTGDCTLEISLGRVLCLQGGRFEVRVYWRHEPGLTDGEGNPTSFDFSDDSGTFWFFDPANVELVVKVLDARPVNGFQWVFYGALSDVEYWITVTDSETETNVTYYNPPREICGLGDVRAFPRPQAQGANLSGESAAKVFPTNAHRPPVVSKLEHGSAGAPCTPGAENLCLSRERYRVEVDWRDPRSGDEGRGMAIPGTTDSGYFWFFDPANVELVVKVLDARTVNGHVWVFFGALTDVEYTVTVTDTETGLAKTYRNEPGNICGQADVRAF